MLLGPNRFGRKTSRVAYRLLILAGYTSALALLCGCAVSKKHVAKPMAIEPALSASKAELLARYDHQAASIENLTATVHMTPTAGSALSGVIEQYHEVNGFILAARPAFIRVIGQAPIVAKDIFDMVSDGQTFRIYIPSKNKFIIGPNGLQHPANKPIENLRPQHLFDALLWPEIPADAVVLLAQAQVPPKRYYVLIIAEHAPDGWRLDREVWFDRVDLNMARIQILGAEGEVVSDVSYGDWQQAGALDYPREISLARPADEYQIEIRITQLTLNQPIPRDRFQLAQPPGTELVQLGEGKGP
jgi:outer membrane lipoprotein-sorting protein